jgi:gliding motility-associated-like protein
VFKTTVCSFVALNDLKIYSIQNFNMKNQFYYLFLMLFLKPSNSVGQQFQKLFDPLRPSFGYELDKNKTGDYVYNSYGSNSLQPLTSDLNLTKITKNGKVLWSFDYRFPTPVKGGSSNLEYWPSENAWLFSVMSGVYSRNKGLVKVDEQGEVLWAKSFGVANDVQNSNIGRLDMVILPDNNVFVAGGAYRFLLNDARNDIFISKIKPDGTPIFEKQLKFYENNKAKVAITDLMLQNDGNLLITGSFVGADEFEQKLMLTKVNSEGDILWSKTYDWTGNVTAASKEIGYESIELANGNTLVSGLFGENLDLESGLLMELDTNGEPVNVLSVEIDDPLKYNVQINHALLEADNKIVFSATATGKVTGSPVKEFNMLAKVSLLTGQLDWQWNYFDETLFNGYITPFDALIRNNSGGYFLLHNEGIGFDILRPILISTDSTGRTGCEQPISLRVTKDIPIAVSNLSPTVKVLNTVQDLVVIKKVFDKVKGFDFHLVADSTLCNIYNFLIDATTTDANDYKWNTGENTPTINVNTSGIYAVTVTNEEKCFKLIDSVRIDFKSTPSLTLMLNDSNYCKTDSILLYALGNSQEVSWSNGQKGDSIFVYTEGIFSATIDNGICGISSASLDVTFPFCPIEPCIVQFANAFTPNGDNTNDRFGPTLKACLTFEKYQFSVYNRWGGLVFTSSDQNQTWDGNTNESFSPMDVYVFVCNYKILGEKENTIKGDISLLR